MNAIGIHVYAGGFTVGIQESFNVLAHFENTDYGAETVKANLNVNIHKPVWPYWRYNNIDLVYGNPPCAPWSSLGVGRGTDDPRFLDTLSIIDAADIYNPKFIVFESVQNILKKGRYKLEELEKLMLSKGYSVTHLIHNAQEFGIPQRRKRYFFVAHAVEFQPTPPDCKSVTVREALQNVSPGGYKLIRPCCERIWKNRLHLIKPGQVMRKVQLPDGEKNKTAIGCYRLDGDGVARAFVGDYTIIHHEENRAITVDEAKAICGFPKDYQIIATSRQKALNQLAQGVMPPVAKWLGEQINHSIKKNIMLTRQSVQYYDATSQPEQKQKPLL